MKERNKKMNYQERIIQLAKEKYLKGVPFEEVLEEVFNSAFLGGQMFFFSRIINVLVALNRRKKEYEEDGKKNN